MGAPVVVTGGTGELGRQVVRQLGSAGRVVRVVSRRPRPAADRGPYDWAAAELMTGDGLRDALAGAATVVHCAGRYRPKEDVAAVRTLLDAARSAGIEHLVAVSIVGIDRIPFPYYRGKVEIEEAIVASGVLYTILRTTQFHELLRTLLAVAAVSPVMPVIDLPFQPIDTGVVAARLAELAGGPPVGRAADLGGPEVRRLTELARDFLAITGRRRAVCRSAFRVRPSPPSAAVSTWRRRTRPTGRRSPITWRRSTPPRSATAVSSRTARPGPEVPDEDRDPDRVVDLGPRAGRGRSDPAFRPPPVLRLRPVGQPAAAVQRTPDARRRGCDPGLGAVDLRRHRDRCGRAWSGSLWWPTCCSRCRTSSSMRPTWRAIPVVRPPPRRSSSASGSCCR